MKRRTIRVLIALLALVVVHEVALHALAPANLVPQLLSHGGYGAAFIALMALAFMLLRLCVLVMVPAALSALLFDTLKQRIDCIRSRNRIRDPLRDGRS
jgi:hypothetical protein